MNRLQFLFKTNVVITLALILGILCGIWHQPIVVAVASTISEIFINLLKLVSLPIIFLSIISTASSMKSLHEVKQLGGRVVKYTLLTTLIAAAIALIVFQIVDPASAFLTVGEGGGEVALDHNTYLSYLINMVPSNIVQPFIDNHVIGVLFIAILLSAAIITLADESRKALHTLFSSLYSAVMKITTWILYLMPIAIWAFVTLFVIDLRGEMAMEGLALYLGCVVAANLLQAFITLPLLLKWKGIAPAMLARQMAPALSTAFFSKSSSAALPMAMRCAEKNAGISRKVSSFSLPLCTTINMNACAAFILTTVLFVSMSQGMTFTLMERIIWIFIATIAAVGNAGVPMGCYFIASAFLAAMNVPMHILGVILPVYSLIDMLESAINVWSDSCVTAVVDKELAEDQGLVSGEGEPVIAQ